MPTLPLSSRLLRTAEAILRSEGYLVTSTDIGGGAGPLLIAQNELFIVGLCATASVQDLVDVHAFASAKLLDLVVESELGAKRWDVYLVLLTAELVIHDSEAYRQLMAINYDVMGLRRLARAGVGAGADDVKTALRSFLGLPGIVDNAGIADPLRQLETELANRGVPQSQAARAIAHFKSSGSLADV